MCFWAQFIDFFPPFLYLDDKDVFMINMFMTNDMYFSFCIFYVLLKVYMQLGFILNAAWRFFNIFPLILGVKR